VTLRGTNPNALDVKAYLLTKLDSVGFDRILEQESKFKHFNTTNEPTLVRLQTGNIGWDMTRAANVGKTEVELHKRDSGSYSRPPGAGANWRHYGVCYADHVLR
jgi:hypothetical protein